MRVLTILLALVPLSATAQPRPVELPDGKGGIGFDDLRFDAALPKLLVPAGRSGNVDLVDPSTGAATPIGGFTKHARDDAGHGQSVTSVDAGEGWLFATDRDAMKLSVIDVQAKKIVAQAPLSGAPDYVRFVAATREVWVTEPGKKGVELFGLSKATPPVPSRSAFIDTPGGPESLVVDGKRGRAYTHRLLLVGCEDGTATVLDVEHDGALRSTVKSGSGVDIIAYDAGRAHLYLPGDESATMAIIGVSAAGALTVLGVQPTVKDAHCVATDERGHAFVCDPRGGRLLMLTDPYPAQGSK